MSDRCCEGVRPVRFSRRYFLKSSGIAMVGLSAMPAFLQRAVAASPTTTGKKQFVVLFQRGAADGLNIVVPFGEPNYYRLRPTIAILATAARRDRCCDRSGRIFRTASEPGPARAAVSPESVGHCACGGIARSDAVAFRRSRFHGVRNAWTQGHRRRLAESRSRCGAGGKRVAISRRRDGIKSAAHAARERLR